MQTARALARTLQLAPQLAAPRCSSLHQGELEVTTEKGTGKGKAAAAAEDVVERMPFLLLGLDLPAAPLFKDALEKNIIPQVPIFNIMRKFDGTTVTDDIRAGRRRFRVTRLPNYLCLHMKRFTKVGVPHAARIGACRALSCSCPSHTCPHWRAGCRTTSLWRRTLPL